ncbi:MAG: TonB-dependent receptor [Paludibacter sp.]|nr:TonB-dependent receptor [Paludibacter sp.]
MRKIFISLLIFTAICANGQHFIKGKVVDNYNNEPIYGATVKLLKSNDNSILLTTVTNINGEFIFENLTEKSFEIEVSCIGYIIVRKKASLDNSLTIKMFRDLIRDDFYLDDVTVYSTRAKHDSPIAHTTIRNDEIAKGNGGQDIPYLLALTPSFVATSDAGAGIGYTNFRIRGTEANRINVTTNGIPLNDAESHESYFVDLPDFASSLASVQVQRGVGASTNGAAAFGASINMETLQMNSNPYGEISATYGSFNTRRYTLKAGTGKIDKKFAAEARISGISSDGYIDRAKSDLKSYYAAAGYFGNNNSLKFITFGGKEKTYQAWNGVDLDKIAVNPLIYSRTYNDAGKYTDDNGVTQFYKNQIDDYTQTHYQLHFYQNLLNSRHYLDFNVALHYTKGKGFYEEYKTKRKYKEYLLTSPNGSKTTDLIRQKWLDNDFYGGIFALNYEFDNFKAALGGGLSNYYGKHFGKILWVRNPADDFVAPQDWYNGNSDKTDGNIYLKLNYQIIKNLTITADFQYRGIEYKLKGTDDKFDENTMKMRDLTQDHTFNFFNPKIGANYYLNSKNSVYASFSVANREPNRNCYTEAGENQRPTSERLFDAEFGYRLAAQRFTAEVNLYNMQYKNQLILTGQISDIGELLSVNIPKSYRRGIEISGAVKISDLLSWNGNFSLNKNKIKEFTEFVSTYDADWNYLGQKPIEHKNTDIAYSPNIVANSIFCFDYKQLNLQFISSYVGRQFIDNTQSNDRSLAPYFVNNAAVNYFWKMQKIDGIAFQLLVNNIFNTEYSSNAFIYDTYFYDTQRINEKRYFPQAGTNLLFTTTVKF